LWRALKDDGLSSYVQPTVPLQRYGDKQRRLRFAAEQKDRDWRRCVFADEKTFVCDARPNRRNDVIWTDSPRTIKPVPRVAHAPSINVYGAFSAAGKCPLYFFSGQHLHLDPRVNYATGSRRLVWRRALDLPAGQ
jgi:hypothetical protein